MDALALAVLALPVGGFWLWFFVRRSRYRPVPARTVGMTFLYGVLSAIPAAILEVLILGEDLAAEARPSFGSLAAAMLLVVGPVEECVKFGACWLGARRSRYMEEPLDGLVHGVAAAVGFATIENMVYIVAFGPAILAVRGFTLVAHIAFAMAWAYPFALYIQRPSTRTRMALLAGLAAAAAVHGLFNVIVLSSGWLVLLFLPVMLFFGAKWTLGRFAWGQRVSPFRYRRNYPLTACATCGELVRVGGRHCRHCGAALRRTVAPLVCGQCRHENRPGAHFCVQCGDRFVLARPRA